MHLSLRVAKLVLYLAQIANMKYIFTLLLYSYITTFNTQLCAAQQLQASSIFQIWDLPYEEQHQMLKAKKFTKVYGGPKKEGGFLYLFHCKVAKEYLFINYDEAYHTTLINYYMASKAHYLKFITPSNTNSLDYKILPQGLTLYEDGKKYYQVILTKK